MIGMLLLRPNPLRWYVSPLLRLVDDLPNSSYFPLVWVDESLDYLSEKFSSTSLVLSEFLFTPLRRNNLQYCDRGLCGIDSRDP